MVLQKPGGTPPMKKTLSSFSSSYLAELRAHLRKRTAPLPETTRNLGFSAIALGLDTLDLARVHEDAWRELTTPRRSANGQKTLSAREHAFFAETLIPIEETRRGARDADVHLKAAVETLTRHTAELTASNEALKQEIAQREAVEDSLKTSEQTSSQLLKRSLKMQSELRELSRQLLSSQEEERKRISRELHDVIAQTLAGVNLRLASLKVQSIANARELKKKIATTQLLVQQSMDVVHRFASDLRPTALDDLGFVPAIRSFIHDYSARTRIRVEFTSFSGVERLDSALRTVLYRVVQESLTNAARHSGATVVKISVRSLRQATRLEVHDNGIGFDAEALRDSDEVSHLGLIGMKERVEMVGGTFSVVSSPGKETTIRAELPRAMASKKKQPRPRSS